MIVKQSNRRSAKILWQVRSPHAQRRAVNRWADGWQTVTVDHRGSSSITTRRESIRDPETSVELTVNAQNYHRAAYATPPNASQAGTQASTTFPRSKGTYEHVRDLSTVWADSARPSRKSTWHTWHIFEQVGTCWNMLEHMAKIKRALSSFLDRAH